MSFSLSLLLSLVSSNSNLLCSDKSFAIYSTCVNRLENSVLEYVHEIIGREKIHRTIGLLHLNFNLLVQSVRLAIGEHLYQTPKMNSYIEIALFLPPSVCKCFFVRLKFTKFSLGPTYSLVNCTKNVSHINKYLVCFEQK